MYEFDILLTQYTHRCPELCKYSHYFIRGLYHPTQSNLAIDKLIMDAIRVGA